MIAEMRELLQKHSAAATFFLCSDYTMSFEEEARGLLADGHEFANHGTRDTSYYPLSSEDFEAELLRANREIERVAGDGKKTAVVPRPTGQIHHRDARGSDTTWHAPRIG